MVRTKATTSLAFIVLAASAALSGARADYSYPRSTPTFCEEMPPEGLSGTRSRDGFIGGDGTTGPTFPSACRQSATVLGIDQGLPPRWRR